VYISPSSPSQRLFFVVLCVWSSFLYLLFIPSRKFFFGWDKVRERKGLVKFPSCSYCLFLLKCDFDLTSFKVGACHVYIVSVGLFIFCVYMCQIESGRAECCRLPVSIPLCYVPLLTPSVCRYVCALRACVVVVAV
jgi:hypothetical protein